MHLFMTSTLGLLLKCFCLISPSTFNKLLLNILFEILKLQLCEPNSSRQCAFLHWWWFQSGIRKQRFCFAGISHVKWNRLIVYTPSLCSVLSIAALQALKRKKRYEKQLAQIDGTLSTIEFQREALENANTSTEVLKNMGFAAKALKAAHNNM